MRGAQWAAPSSRGTLGRVGEEAAATSYRKAGYRVVARNWRCQLGEIDLILARGTLVVFCEVKTRRVIAYGPPFEAVTHRKQRKLRALAETFLRATRTGAGSLGVDVRFDVASVTLGPDGRPELHLFEGAF